MSVLRDKVTNRVKFKVLTFKTSLLKIKTKELLCQVQSGETVIKEGDDGDNFYVIDKFAVISLFVNV